MDKILSVVCAYFPDNNRLSLLVSALMSAGDVVVVNNGGPIDFDLPSGGNRVSVLDSGRNLGTLASYNLVISQQPGYSYYWLWDQDSVISKGDVDKFVSRAKRCFDDNEDTACVTVFDKKNYISPLKRELVLTKASTSLMSKARVEKLLSDWFDEKLFMDYGDWDFSYRLFKAGGKVGQLDDIHIGHQLGDPEKTIFGPINRSSSMRLHMQGINTAYLIKKHGVMNFLVFLLVIRLFIVPIKNFLFNESLKRNKLFFSGVFFGVNGGFSSDYSSSVNKRMK